MYGEARISGPVATGLCSMGGIGECGVSVDTKASPRRMAIEKAQEELRQEYDVREERRRELEFLEKGGNPLDFKLGHVASLSVQSTSVMDQIAEQNVISEARCSFAFAASPHGDSVESSGRQGNSLCREGNTADNLMLLDGDTSNTGGAEIVKRGVKRTNTAQSEQVLHGDGQNNAEEGEDSGLFRPKSQAYARRRSKSSRENANIALVRSLPVPPLSSQQKDVTVVIQEAKTEDHVVSSIDYSKSPSPNCKNILKNASLDDNMAMKIDGFQAIHEGKQTSKTDLTNINNGNGTMEISLSHVTDNSHLAGGCQTDTVTTSAETPEAILKEAVSRTSCSHPHVSNEILREAHNPEKACRSNPIESVVKVHADGMDNKSAAPHSAIESTTLSDNKVGLTSAHATKAVDEHPGKCEIFVPGKASETADESLNKILPVVKDGTKDGQLEVSSSPIVVDDGSTSVQPELSNFAHVKDEMHICNSALDAQKDRGHIVGSDHDRGIKDGCSNLCRNNSCSTDSSVAHKVASVTVPPTTSTDIPNPVPSVENTMLILENDVKKSNGDQDKMAKKECEDSIVAKKEYEDSILRWARVIEANIKKAREQSNGNITLETKRKSHWDFVLEEMAWMANDFMQECLWKSAAAAQMCRWIAFGGRAKFEEAVIQRKQKSVARILASGIMNFWRSIDTLRASGQMPKPVPMKQSNGLEEKKLGVVKDEIQQDDDSLEQEKLRLSLQSPIQRYALRLLEYNSNVSECQSLAEAPPTPDRLNDIGILKMSDQLSEPNLFYEVAPGAMCAYRKSVEHLFVYNRKASNTLLKDDYELLTFDSVADLSMDNAYGDEEAVAHTYLVPGTSDVGASKLRLKTKHPLHLRMNGAHPYETGADMPYEPFPESKSRNQQVLSNGKRIKGFLSVPIKRIRTAARQRVVSPFPAGVAGNPQFISKMDASSGDTNSCQDDQSSLHGGSFTRKNADIESTVDFDGQLFYDCSEVSTKSKKKKKPKHPGYKIVKTPQSVAESCSLMAPGKGTYDPRPQVDLISRYEQKDYLTKRSENHRFDSNGNIVVNGLHASKKLKLTNQAPDISLEALTPALPMVSPVASQMSYMANATKVIKINTRGRKSKGLKTGYIYTRNLFDGYIWEKGQEVGSWEGTGSAIIYGEWVEELLHMAAGLAGPGGLWSVFEEQALVVLVHDMGENWELVSDALNSIVQFKCIYRRPNECMERHKLLMDKNSGDGPDSADDSGSSKHYQSALPGIPKGSARQLFERLQGPLEEEILKEHFEKIIVLGQRLHQTRRKGEIQELKHVNPLHNSHVHALSQACPNNLPGGIMTPLDLCDAVPSNSDALSIGYPGSHTSGLVLSNNHGSICPTVPTSNVNSRLPGSPGIVLGNNLPSPSTLNAPSRGCSRYGVPRTASLLDDDQTIIQYNPMLNGRNLQQPVASVPGVLPSGVDRGVRVMPGSHGMGMMTGLNRGPSVSRPGFPRVGSPGVLNMVSSGNMSPNNGDVMQNAVNVHPGAIAGPGNTLLRPRDPIQMLRPGNNSEEHRQMMMPEFQLQVSPGNNQPVNFSGPPFSNVGASSPVQLSQPHQIPQQPHVFGNTHTSHVQGTIQGNQQQPSAMRLAKAHMQQMVPQQQHLLSGSGAVSPVQNGSQMQKQQSQGPATSVNPSSQPQQKQQHPAQNPLVPPNQPSSTTSHKQKKQQGQQQSRQNQQQRNQGSQQAKLMKSLGRGNMMHQSPVGTSQATGISTTCKNQVADKNVKQPGTGCFSSGSNGSLPSITQPGNSPKIYASQMPQSRIQTPNISNQDSVKGSPNHTLLASQHAPLRSPSQLVTQQQQRYMNPSHNNIQRLTTQQNRHMTTDAWTELPVDQVQHNQVMQSVSLARSADSGSPGISSRNQRRQDSSHGPAAATSTSQLASSPQVTLVGNDSLLSSSSQAMLQRQMSGGVPIHGHGIGVQLQQQQSQQQLQSQHQQRPVVHGSIYAHSSNSGPG
ncbi:hypothetical protein ACP4OV_011451 [Aristida adscensionis]